MLNVVLFTVMSRNITKIVIQFLCLVAASAFFFLTYSFSLTGHFTIWNGIFFLYFVTVYFSLRIIFPKKIWSIIRTAGATVLVFLSLVNFAHFRILNSFVTGGSGFGRIPNFSEMTILVDYWTSIPYVIYTGATLLVAHCIYLEFFWNALESRPTVTAKRATIMMSIILTVMVFAIPAYYSPASWYATENYYSDIGPIGYLGVDAASHFLELVGISRKNSFVASLDTKNSREDNSMIDLLAQLAIRNDYEAITLPDFKTPPNIIIYQLESVPRWVIDLEQSPMPFLKELMNKGITVDHFYGNDCHTIGAEFTSVCSVLTSSAEVIGNRLEPLNFSCLPHELRTSFKYESSVYHANVPSFWNRDTLLPQLGYTHLYFSPFFTPRAYDGIVASELVSKTASTNKPTFSYLIGFTSHSPHTAHYIERNQKESGIIITPYDGILSDVTKSVQVSEEELRNYFGFLRSVDGAVQGLFDDLNESGAINDTIVVLFGDHRYYSFSGSSGRQYQLYNELPFVMWVPGMSPKKIPITASHIDIAPTIMDLLKSPKQSTQFMGKSIFSPERYNYALGKCADEVYYFTSDMVVRGNQKLGLYSSFSTVNNEPAVVDQKRVQMIADAATMSDRIWSYDADFLLPDKTLVKGASTDVYIIDNGYKRRIESEDIFVRLGYNWLDIHQLPDKTLNKYPTGDPVDTVISHLQRDDLEASGSSSILRPSSKYNFKKYVAHALGSAGGVTACNCLEAFEESYAKGYRLFEADLALTADKKIVLFHTGNEPRIGSEKTISAIREDDFKNLLFDERLTLLTINDLFKLMEKKPDTYVIIDPKDDFEPILKQLVQIGRQEHPNSLSRIIPQIYTPEQLAVANALYDFNDIIYTLYVTEPTDESVLSFVKNQEDVTAITMRDQRYNDVMKSRLREEDISLFVHTVNDPQAILRFTDNDVGVYTDAIPQAD